MLLTPEQRQFPRYSILTTLEMFRYRKLTSIVEIGCMRGPLTHKLEELNINCCMDGHSSIYWAKETDSFVTVDIDPESIRWATTEVKKHLNKDIKAYCMDGIKYLEDRQEKIDLLFLDSWDANYPDSADNHLKAFIASESKLHENSLVLIDDTDCKLIGSDLHFSDTGLEGKGEKLIPYAESKGWKVIFSGRQTLLSK